MNKDNLKYILWYVNCEIIKILDRVTVIDEEVPPNLAIIVNNCIECYIDVMIDFDENFRFQDVKEYILNSGYSEKQYRVFVSRIKSSSGSNMDMDKKSIIYILEFFKTQVDRLIKQVLLDSEDDPNYSAVTANNCIKSYMEVMRGLSMKDTCKNVKDYFLINQFTLEEYLMFERKRKIESVYYKSVQF